MNKYLQQLVNLSQIDQKIDNYAPRIESINRNLQLKKDEIATIDENIEKVDTEITELKAQIANTNSHINEFNAKIKDISKKTSAVKSEKEIKALNLEEDLAKDQLEAANEEIGRLERIIDSKNELKTELEQKKSNAQSALDSLNSEVEGELKAIEDERSKIYDQKEKLLADMNQKILTFYEKIRKWAKNTAVVPVKKQACYGCFMKINDKTYAHIIKSEDITTCPHCGRILYKETIEE
ncbi:MAG: zinc ribbon domain-containing protein [Campylobacter sp.]|uniref:zinc ribbon domain-containing protein n=1 Tax=Campylobacter sp. TaxID=205 RepID=UPI001B2EDE71|nr:zinc ribbon domain-containing protein [Campylobacter sp.]MBO7154282.1 zinc ribbon domain-containing protein [Campylobacter sp.]